MLIKVIFLAQINIKEFMNIIKDYLIFLENEITIAQAKYKDNIN